MKLHMNIVLLEDPPPPPLYFFKFLLSLVPVWQLYELVKWE